MLKEDNPELSLAWRFIENTGENLFLTGKAGTGKTTFLRNLREKSCKRIVVLAPTGIAAINAVASPFTPFFSCLWLLLCPRHHSTLPRNITSLVRRREILSARWIC